MCCCDKPKTESKTEVKPGAGSCCGAPKAATPITETDPVCGMKVDPANAAPHKEHGGKTYYFCSQGCATKFRNAPDTYLQPKEKVAGSSESAASPKPSGYTCPMHPEIHKDGPGDAPSAAWGSNPSP